MTDFEVCPVGTMAALAAGKEKLRDEVIAAYKQGAMDVHQNYHPDRAPDFTEAAHDYAVRAADSASAAREG